MIKSNNGPDSCCYQYCSQESVYQSVCKFCNLSSNDGARSSAELNTTSPEDKITRFEKAYKYSKPNNEFPPQSCQLVPGLSLTTSRCEIPYYASCATTPFHWIVTSTGNAKNIFLAQTLIFLLKFINSRPMS